MVKIRVHRVTTHTIKHMKTCHLNFIDFMNPLQTLRLPLHNSTHQTYENKIALYYSDYPYQNLNYSSDLNIP